MGGISVIIGLLITAQLLAATAARSPKVIIVGAGFSGHGGLYERSTADESMKLSEDVNEKGEKFSNALPASGRQDISILTNEKGEKFSNALPASGRQDISILTYQRLQNHVPSTPLDMAIDYYAYDYEFAEPPRSTISAYWMFILSSKVVRKISHSKSGATVTTEDGSVYEADYVMVSVSLGVLQTKLIDFQPDLPQWKILAVYQFDMAVYTKIFLKFPYRFWPGGNGTEFFLYASERRGYYPIWQHFEKQYPGANVLLVTVTEEESRRIEQQSDAETKEEAMEVLRSMFGSKIPNAIDILVPRWWSDRFYKGTFSNWPLGVNRYEYDQIRAPVGRVYFTGEHTSEHYNGYVHGAYLAGIDSANMMIDCIKKKMCKFMIKAKDEN
ncbi:uncharacterized protein A4U43_C08F10600 [Asparagus officinalis]|nr:uncharacterized protein A4U43_C08F10600 [Asparagus officinalis]